jgi:hypothetical protein
MAFRNVYLAGGNGIGYTAEVDSSGDYGSVSNDMYFKDLSKGIGGIILYKSGEGNIVPIFDQYTITATGSLTAAQINDLDATAVDLVDGVSGKIFVPESVVVEYMGGGTSYTVSGHIELGYNTFFPICQFCNSSVLGGTDYSIQLSQTVAGADTYTSLIVGAPLQVFSSTPISGGTSEIHYSIKYRIVDMHI